MVVIFQEFETSRPREPMLVGCHGLYEWQRSSEGIVKRRKDLPAWEGQSWWPVGFCGCVDHVRCFLCTQGENLC